MAMTVRLFTVATIKTSNSLSPNGAPGAPLETPLTPSGVSVSATNYSVSSDRLHSPRCSTPRPVFRRVLPWTGGDFAMMTRCVRWFAVVYLVFAQFAGAQEKSSTPSEVEQHIQRVTSGLIGPVILKGDQHAARTLSQRMKDLNVPGVSIAVIHGGKIEWARGFGFRSVGGPPVDDATLFQAASISKPLSAMAVLRLVQQGKLSLDADINTYLSTWKLPTAPVAAGKPVTLRELLAHTGGISVHGFPGYARGVEIPTLVQVLNGEKPANTQPIRIEAPPGDHWQYSGGGYTIMQQMLIDISKEAYPKLMHDNVLAPVGMIHSTYQQPLPASLEGNAATPYRGDGKPVEGGAHTYPEMAAAGLWTTPSDLARYAIEVQNSLQGKANHVLSAEMTQQMVSPGKGNWGLGVEIGGSKDNPYFSHGGANEGFRCIFVAYENRRWRGRDDKRRRGWTAR